MAIRLTESRLRQIIREEASKLTRRPVSRRTRRLRETADPKFKKLFKKYFETILSNADNQEFFAGSPVKSVAQDIVEDTLAYDFDWDDAVMTPALIDSLTQALLDKHKELSDEGYEGLGGGYSDDDDYYDYPSFP